MVVIAACGNSDNQLQNQEDSQNNETNTNEPAENTGNNDTNDSAINDQADKPDSSDNQSDNSTSNNAGDQDQQNDSASDHSENDDSKKDQSSSNDNNDSNSKQDSSNDNDDSNSEQGSSNETDQSTADGNSGQGSDSNKSTDSQSGDDDAVHVVANPTSVAVLVNKQYMLPDGYDPTDLVYPDVPFTFNDKREKRQMRKVAADALEKMFAGAEKDGVHLLGASGYRSYATQKSLFDYYVQRDGKEKAKTYSAIPGHSEHQTGLAIDLAGKSSQCIISDCFANTVEAKWLAKHASEYGFIIRYPKGKEDITGYKYEPWHMRYVGKDTAQEIASKEITLEKYMGVVPVSESQ